MPLNIKNAEADRLAHLLAEATGESVTRAVTEALRDRLALIRRRNQVDTPSTDVRDIQRWVGSLPDRDRRTPEEILGYDAFGLPT